MVDPFNKNAIDLQFNKFSLSEILRMSGIDFKTSNTLLYETVNGKLIPEANMDPVVLINGKFEYYQRPLVWSIENKQNLIDSIYNNMNIGTFVFARYDWNIIESRIKENIRPGIAFHDVIDGKQRINTLAEFINNKFTDSSGNLFSELSDIAKRKFKQYSKLSCAILENPSDDLIIKAFLNVNFAGVPLSKEHIEYVKSLNSK